MREFHKPVRRPGDIIEALHGAGDPAELGGLAHDTAAALLHRVRTAPDPRIVDRLIGYADEHGIDDVAELWADAPAETLPGALWRLYLVRHTVAANPEDAGRIFAQGAEVDGVNQAIAGSPHAPTPAEVVVLVNQILRGAFTGDFAVALERASAFSRVMAAGAAELGPRHDDHERLAAGYTTMAEEFTMQAKLWRSGQLT
ncbi:hypothetical protein [Tessaracoccus sp. ZS01]|uniref:hypothetical protein n=1 Tax=Tessaracoccus sp. ZS01 TaxID=1906324 RepID=UPI00096BED00|nr:hypothetical protein [Tessaracoccus sp. ZS01]MCG6568667.1 DNA-directed RNA polymerase subunit beta [Tessaracoccus sp. ZS01]OMG51993.1 hypothetical protein BJN44_13700 [Tessaracoccus sp. ZS01]